MNNEQERQHTNQQSTSQYDPTFSREQYTRYRESNAGLDDTTESVVHGGRSTRDQSFEVHDDRRDPGGGREQHLNDAGFDTISEFPANPLGVNLQQQVGLGNIIQTTLATSANTTTTTTSASTNRTSTPNYPNQTVRTVDQLAVQMGQINLQDAIRPPDYLPSNEQVQRIHHIELQEQKASADTAKHMYRILNALIENQPEAVNLIPLRDSLGRQAQVAAQTANDKLTSLRKAQTVVNYYKSPIQKPVFLPVPDDYRKTFHRTSPKEIMSVTGTYDPKNGNADFQHIWSKLIGYGQANYFNEQEYKDALRYILQGDAYDTFLSFEQTNQTFHYMIEYFGQVYMKKRTRDADRQAVDKFARLKDEPLEVCMHRSQVAIDRLRHLHRDTEWPEARKAMRRNILTQVITDETRKYIQMEEDETLESMGYTYDLETLIRMASKYEKLHNKAPKKELSTVFQVASGGLVDDPQKLKNELLHLKKENFSDKNLLRELVTELIANPAMPRRFSSTEGRETRRSSRDDDRRNQRRDSFNASRKMEVDTSPLLPNTPSTQLQSSHAYNKNIEFPPRSPRPPSQPPPDFRQQPQMGNLNTRPNPGRSPSPFQSGQRPDNRDFNRPDRQMQSQAQRQVRPYSRDRQYSQERVRQQSQERARTPYQQRNYYNNYRDYSNDRQRENNRGYNDRPSPDYRRRNDYSRERERDYNRENRSSNNRFRDYSRERERENYRNRSTSSDRIKYNNRKNLAIEDRSRAREKYSRNSSSENQSETQNRNRAPSPNSKNVYVTINGVEYKKLPNQEN